jgi:chromosome partitioning protein
MLRNIYTYIFIYLLTYIMTKTIGLIQVKGGTGRSTLATNIPGMIADSKTVAPIDRDLPQATSASWYAIRKSTALKREK